MGFTASKLYKDYRRPECLRWHSVGNLRQFDAKRPSEAGTRNKKHQKTLRSKLLSGKSRTCFTDQGVFVAFCSMMLACLMLHVRQVPSRAIFCAFAPGGDLVPTILIFASFGFTSCTSWFQLWFQLFMARYISDGSWISFPGDDYC